MSHSVKILLVVCVTLGYGLMELATRCYQRSVHPTKDDTKLELLMFLSLVVVTQPVIFLAMDKLCTWLMPAQRGALAHWPWWAMVGLLLVFEDGIQYAWHRASHTPLLWPFHRAHHTATYMSARMTYRNNFFYYLVMPNLWFAGVAVYLGFGGVYLGYMLFKLLVMVGAHSAWPWDAPLYRIRALRPVMWVVQRTISTPSTHWAHHALTNADGVGHYTGNFGPLLFLWDIIFRTGHIDSAQRYPAAVGLKDDLILGRERWFHECFFPLVRSKRARSVLQPGGRVYAETECASDLWISHRSKMWGN